MFYSKFAGVLEPDNNSRSVRGPSANITNANIRTKPKSGKKRNFLCTWRILFKRLQSFVVNNGASSVCALLPHVTQWKPIERKRENRPQFSLPTSKCNIFPKIEMAHQRDRRKMSIATVGGRIIDVCGINRREEERTKKCHQNFYFRSIFCRNFFSCCLFASFTLRCCAWRTGDENEQQEYGV